MQRAVQVAVALLNVIWILFFLTADPFSLSVQRRSSDEGDGVFGEFCIQLPKINISSNKSNNTNESAETLISWMLGMSTPADTETHILDQDKTISLSAGLDFIKQANFGFEEYPEYEEDEYILNSEPPPSPRFPSPCCQTFSSDPVNNHFTQPGTNLETQSPPDCPIHAYVITKPSGERLCFRVQDGSNAEQRPGFQRF